MFVFIFVSYILILFSVSLLLGGFCSAYFGSIFSFSADIVIEPSSFLVLIPEASGVFRVVQGASFNERGVFVVAFRGASLQPWARLSV